MRRILGLVVVVAIAAMAHQAQAASIALNFYGLNPFTLSGMDQTDTGGVITQNNWNNTGSDGSDGGTATLSGAPLAWHGRDNLVDHSGAATTMDMSFLNPDPVNWGPYSTVPGKMGLDGTRGSGFDSSNAGIRLSNIPYANYDIYVLDSNNTGWITLLSNVSGATQDIYAGGESPAVRAIQIWDLQPNNGNEVVPEPSTVALLALGGIGMIGFALRKKYRRA